MIALLAAVPEETRLVRQTCPDLQCRKLHGLKVWQGQHRNIPLCLTHSGIGKAAAAAAATTLLLEFQPKALWLFGCGGAYPASDLTVGDLALADLEIFGDEGVETGDGFRTLAAMELPMRQIKTEPMYNAWPVDQQLSDWAETTLRPTLQQGVRLTKGPFLTVSACTGTSLKAQQLSSRTGAICENMEGAAVALACQQFEVPFFEIRGISNLVEDRDPARWDLPAGMVAAQKSVLSLLEAWPID